MKAVFLTFLLAAALVLERFTAGWFSVYGVSVPFFFFCVALSWWRMPFGWRLLYAGLAGIAYDSLSFFPPGIFIAVFFIAAWCAEFLRNMLPEATSRMSRSVGVCLEMLCFFAAVPVFMRIVQSISGTAATGGIFSVSYSAGAFFWATLLPSVWFGIPYLWSRLSA